MLFHIKEKNVSINTNLSGSCYEKLINGIWKIGFFDDNMGIDDKNNDEFYQDVGDKEKRHFKNKVNVVLADGSKVYQHICHWNSTDKYFCTTSESFWDQFEKNA